MPLLFPIAVLWILLSVARIYLGVDPLDESSIVAQSQRFLLGDRPFVDDSNFLQTAQLLTLPLFRAFHWVSGGLDGLVLFNRWLGFAFAALVAWAASRLGKTREEKILCASLFLVYCPLQIAGLSYYSLGAGLFFLSRALVGSPFLSGALDALASLVLFPLAGAAAVAAYFDRKHLARRAAGFGLGLALASLAIGLTPALLAEQIHRLNQSRIPHQDFLALSHFARMTLLWLVYLARPGFLALVTLLLLGRRYPWAKTTALIVAPLLLWWTNRSSLGGMGAEGVVFHLMFLAPLLARETEFPWRYWIPSLAAGVVLSFASQRHLTAAAVGLLPGAALALAALTREKPAAWISAAAILFGLFQMQFPARDLEVRAAIRGGPYEGLFVKLVDKTQIEALGADLRGAAGEPGKVLVLGGKPSSYLLTPLRPAASNLWRTCYDTEGIGCAEYYAGKLGEISLAVVHREDWIAEKMGTLVNAIRRECTHLDQAAGYDLFRCGGNRQQLAIHRSP